jgi:hypothetical protein
MTEHIKGPIADIEAIAGDHESALNYPRYEIGHEWPSGREVLVYTERQDNIVYSDDGLTAAYPCSDLLKQRLENVDAVSITVAESIDPAQVSRDQDDKFVVQVDVIENVEPPKGKLSDDGKKVEVTAKGRMKTVELAPIKLSNKCKIEDLGEGWSSVKKITVEPDPIVIDPGDGKKDLDKKTLKE